MRFPVHFEFFLVPTSRPIFECEAFYIEMVQIKNFLDFEFEFRFVRYVPYEL